MPAVLCRHWQVRHRVGGLPFRDLPINCDFDIEDFPTTPGHSKPNHELRTVTPGGLEALGVPLLRGRHITAADRLDAQLVVVINQALARKYWHDADPVGRRIMLGDGKNRWATIVGVVADVHEFGLDAEVEPTMYYPVAQMLFPAMTFPTRSGALFVEFHAMGLLTFGLNVTLDGCIDHTQAIADDELHDYWTQLMDQSGAMLFGRNTYELMEGAWPAVARDEKAPRAMREWAQKLEAKAKYVVSGSRSDFSWQNTIKMEGDLREAISALKAKTERGVLVGAPQLSAALEELGLIDEYRIVVHPVISGRGPTLFHGLSSGRHLELLSTQRFKSGVQALHFRRKVG